MEAGQLQQAILDAGGDIDAVLQSLSVDTDSNLADQVTGEDPHMSAPALAYDSLHPQQEQQLHFGAMQNGLTAHQAHESPEISPVQPQYESPSAQQSFWLDCLGLPNGGPQMPHSQASGNLFAPSLHTVEWGQQQQQQHAPLPADVPGPDHHFHHLGDQAHSWQGSQGRSQLGPQQQAQVYGWDLHQSPVGNTSLGLKVCSSFWPGQQETSHTDRSCCMTCDQRGFGVDIGALTVLSAMGMCHNAQAITHVRELCQNSFSPACAQTWSQRTVASRPSASAGHLRPVTMG